jgi:two-component system, OmpR family, response regulator RstA
MSGTTIMLVEDDEPLAEMISDYLEQHGYEVKIEGRGDVAGARILAEQPSLVLLDLSLPGKDGIAICRQVREAYSGPIMMLTARGANEIEGLDVGADDYLTKPPQPGVLLARVRALLRRSAGAHPPAEVLEVGDVRIEPSSREVRVGAKVLALTSGEFDLLWLLASNAGRILSRQQIYDRLRSSAYDTTDRSIDLRVSRLRQKLALICGDRKLIKTVRGVGYLLARSSGHELHASG